jgi:hypothetical protein
MIKSYTHIMKVTARSGEKMIYSEIAYYYMD